jgi:hypothetical protein
VLVSAAGRQLIGETQSIDLLWGEPVPAGGLGRGEQSHREDHLAGPDSVERDVLPHHFRDGMIDLEPAVLAVLGVLPREKPVPGGTVLRREFHGGPAHGQHVRGEVEVLRDE